MYLGNKKNMKYASLINYTIYIKTVANVVNL